MWITILSITPLNPFSIKETTIHTNINLLFTPTSLHHPTLPHSFIPHPLKHTPILPYSNHSFPHNQQWFTNRTPQHNNHPTPLLHSTPSTLNNSPFPPTTLGVPNLASTPPSPISTQGVSTGTGIIAFFKVRTGFLLSNPIPFPCTLAHLSVDTP